MVVPGLVRVSDFAYVALWRVRAGVMGLGLVEFAILSFARFPGVNSLANVELACWVPALLIPTSCLSQVSPIQKKHTCSQFTWCSLFVLISNSMSHLPLVLLCTWFLVVAWSSLRVIGLAVFFKEIS